MTTITIPRALLERALEAIVPNTPAKISLKSAIRAELAKPSITPTWHDAPERKPMSDAEKNALWLVANSERNRLSRQSFLDGVDSAEYFHGIK